MSSEKSWRGGEQQIAYLIEGLKELGINSQVMVKSDSEFERYCENNNIRYFAAPFVNSADVGSAMHLSKIMKRLNPDIIHAHSSKSHGIATLSTFFGVKAPIVLSRRVDFPLKSNFYSKWKYNHPQVKKIICVSKAIQNIVNHGSKKVSTIYSGIDLKRFTNAFNRKILHDQFNLPENAILIGNTSALADHKDYPTFINTAQEFIRTNEHAFFFAAGMGPMKNELENLVVEKGLGERIFFIGWSDDIPSLLKELDIFLITSKTEGLGTSVLDAFASKVPVISTNAGGLCELVRHEDTGLLSEIGDFKSLSRNISRILTETGLKNYLTENAFEFVKEFSYKNTSEKTLQVYKEVLNEG